MNFPEFCVGFQGLKLIGCIVYQLNFKIPQLSNFCKFVCGFYEASKWAVGELTSPAAHQTSPTSNLLWSPQDSKVGPTSPYLVPQIAFQLTCLIQGCFQLKLPCPQLNCPLKFVQFLCAELDLEVLIVTFWLIQGAYLVELAYLLSTSTVSTIIYPCGPPVAYFKLFLGQFDQKSNCQGL